MSIGDDVIAKANELWKLAIRDPPRHGINPRSIEDDRNRILIDGMIRSPQGLGWGWREPYAGDGDFEWCGAFAAYCWGLCGLDAYWRKYYFASTYRLDCYGSYRDFDEEHKNQHPLAPRQYQRFGQSTDVPLLTPQPGDILLIGLKSYGSHICLVESYDHGYFSTIEGNGIGTIGDGGHGHGVVKGRRVMGPLDPFHYHARRLIRPSAMDLNAVQQERTVP